MALAIFASSDYGVNSSLFTVALIVCVGVGGTDL